MAFPYDDPAENEPMVDKKAANTYGCKDKNNRQGKEIDLEANDSDQSDVMDERGLSKSYCGRMFNWFCRYLDRTQVMDERGPSMSYCGRIFELWVNWIDQFFDRSQDASNINLCCICVSVIFFVGIIFITAIILFPVYSIK